MRTSTSRRSYLTAVGGAVLTGGCLKSSESTIRMGVVPDVDPDTAIRQNSGLAEYLESRLDATIDLDTSADYAGMVRSMVAEQVDLAYFGGVSYVLAHHRADAEPVVVGSRDGSTEWHSVFIARASTALSSVSDAVSAPGDYDLVFGDPISTSGTVMPTYYLRSEHDTRPDDFASVTHVGAHDATAAAIATGSGDVGALNARIYDALVERGDVGDDVVELWRTPGFPDYPWAVAPAVDPDLTRRIREAFTKLDDRGRTEILDEQNVDEYVPASHDDFAPLNEGVEMAGLLDEGESGRDG